MKDQWFGDKKDVFKFGVCLELLKSFGIKKLTWIAMKTENEDKEPFSELSCVDVTLRRFFFNIHKPKKALKLGMIKEFLNRQDIKCMLIDEPFEPNDRENYFKKIIRNKNYIANAFILVDPDNGFETDSLKEQSSKHVLFNEIKEIFENMNGSILGVFQHQQRGKSYEETFSYVRKRINKELRRNPLLLCVKNGHAQSLMFLLFKDNKLYEKARDTLNNKNCLDFVGDFSQRSLNLKN